MSTEKKTWPRPWLWTRSEPDPEPRVRVGESESNQTFGRGRNKHLLAERETLRISRQTDRQTSSMTLSRRGEPSVLTPWQLMAEELPVTGFSHAASLHRLKTWHRACDDFTSEGDYCYCFPVEVRLADDKHEIHHEYNIIIQFTTRAFYFKEIFILWTMCLHKLIIIWKPKRRKGQNDLE